MSSTYAEVILPLPLHSTFTYHIPDELNGKIKIGHRVIVPFGMKKFYTGIVSSLSPIAPQGYEIKDIFSILEDYPIIKHPQQKLWQWIADYYMCTIGDVFKAAIPAGLKVESETFVELNPDFEISDANGLNEREIIISQTLDHNGKLTPGEIERKTGFKNCGMIISRMIEKGAVIISEKLVERYRTLTETYVKLNFDAKDSTKLHEAFDKIKRAKKQTNALLTLIHLSDASRRDSELREVTRTELMERSASTTTIINALAESGLIEIYKKEINRFRFDGKPSGILPQLSEAQNNALDEIHRSFFNHDISLLHGVTSSGKTEIYIHLINHILRQGNQALYLVPEIALTTQLTHRLQKVFGDKVVIYHSRFSDNERVDIWKRLLLNHEPCVVIGARSSIFLPFDKLGLIIVDEEHEASYKQYDPAPRYNARDVAILLASMHGAKTLLGSATPSIETYYKASNGKFGLITLSERYEGVKLPSIKIIDILDARKKYAMTGSIANETINITRNSLDNGEQSILFHNRRGFAPIARCKQCAWVPRCSNCDVSLTYHKRLNQLVCHYCGSVTPLPNTCPACKEPAIEIHGFGTERIEDEIQALFPEKKILRMDLDTTRNKDGYANIIDDFSHRKADILVGTQMVTKGLDFAGVSSVGVLNADTLINYPDFRSAERAFNMLEQVAGRAGRRDTEGTVAVQTTQPSHPVIIHLLNHDYMGFYNHEIAERQQFNYPPFTRLIYIYLKHREADTLVELATIYSNRLRQLFGSRVFGPEEPTVSRIQSLYIRKIMLKIEPQASIKKVKEILTNEYNIMRQNPRMKSLTVYYDVDPM